MRALILFPILCSLAGAADPRFDGLRTALIAMRGKTDEAARGPRGAGTALTVAKHQLRDWVEAKLAGEGKSTDAADIQRRLNSELLAAGLLCGERQPCSDWSLAGYLDELTVRRDSVFLILTTGLGIECGFDHSAYIYAWNGERWASVWQNEQDPAAGDRYAPQDLQRVLISPYNKENNYLVLTLGTERWCSSNWHRAYYRLYRLGPDLQSGLLLAEERDAYQPETIRGALTESDILVEFNVGSIDGGVHNRAAIRHYVTTDRGMQRVAPFALSPRDFVDEWLTTERREANQWVDAENRRTIVDWRDRLPKTRFFGEFLSPTKHCQSMPDLWQVGIEFNDTLPLKRAYFLVRWRPPYRFSLADVRDRPWAECTEDDDEADERRTLFPR